MRPDNGNGEAWCGIIYYQAATQCHALQRAPGFSVLMLRNCNPTGVMLHTPRRVKIRPQRKRMLLSRHLSSTY